MAKVFFLAFGVLGAALVLFATDTYGAGITPDSVHYISTAENIERGSGFVLYNGEPFLFQPPLYPLTLITIKVLAGDFLASARILNSVLFGVTVYLSGLLFLKCLSTPAFMLIGTISVVFAIPLSVVSRYAWSEPLFICPTLVFLLASLAYREEKDYRSLVIMAVSAAAAVLTRYIGISVIVAGVAGIVFFYSQNKFQTRLKHAAFFCVVTILPIGIWLVRNYSVSGTFFGPREESLYTFFQNAALTIGNITFWYIPETVLGTPSILVLCGLILLFCAGLVLKAILPRRREILVPILPCILFFASYTSILIITSSTTAYSQIDKRLLAPVSIPTTLLILYFAEKAVATIVSDSRRKTIRVLVTGLLALWLIYPLSAFLTTTNDYRQNGDGYNGNMWSKSPTIRYIREWQLEKPTCPIQSNEVDALYFLTGITAESSPSRQTSGITMSVSDLASEWVEDEKSCLVWFKSVRRTFQFTLEELMIAANMERAAEFDDGTLYVVTQRRS